MKKKYRCFNFCDYSLILFLFQINSILSIVLDNIIPLGEHPHRLSHFSFTSDGDMIIDTNSYPTNNERKFYGLKKNGKYYFKDSNDTETPYLDLLGNDLYKVESESIIIKFENNDSTSYKEYLMGISKINAPDKGNIEIYNFDNKSIKKENTTNVFGNITSYTFSIIEFPNKTDSHFYYLFSYLTDNKYFVIKKAYFNLSNEPFYEIQNILSVSCSDKRIVSCFFTEQLKYICLYENEYDKYVIIVFDKLFINYTMTEIYDSKQNNTQIFFKGIHLKKEIGVFMFYKNDTCPIMTLKECNSNNIIVDYSPFGEIELNKTKLRYPSSLNNLIKINDNKICFICPTYNKKSLIIIIFNLYNKDSEMTIRYYSLNTYNDYSFQFYNEIKAALYNNFICIAFSHRHCSGTNCDNYYSSSFLILSYANNSDNSVDLIQQLNETNKNIENDYCLNLNEKLVINNNIFGYVFKGIKIIDYPNNIYLKNNDIIIEKDSILLKDECILLSFNNVQIAIN